MTLVFLIPGMCEHDFVDVDEPDEQPPFVQLCILCDALREPLA